MREFKFRNWYIETGKHAPGWMDYCELNSLYSHADEDQEYVIMQFTGLHDKNGKEIYEGDIVRWGVNTNLVISFGWGDDGYGYESYGILIGSSVFCVAHQDCEVIGNIYENPELLKGE